MIKFLRMSFVMKTYLKQANCKKTVCFTNCPYVDKRYRTFRGILMSTVIFHGAKELTFKAVTKEAHYENKTI